MKGLISFLRGTVVSGVARGLGLLLSLGLLVGQVHAGNISLAWDPVMDQDLAGYRVYVGSTPGSGDQGILDVGRATSVILTGLADCTNLYVGVKAVDMAGNESVSFSNFLVGMTQPQVSSIAPARLTQGDQNVSVNIRGASFSSRMQRSDLSFDDDDLRVLDLSFVSCNEIMIQLSVGPFLSSAGDPGQPGSSAGLENVAPVEIGQHGLTLTAPDESGFPVRGSASDVLTVDLLPSRSDADNSGVVDGFDLVRLSRAFGSSQGGQAYDPAVDLDGDKEINGLDLTILADFFGLSF
ncbi:MAG: dockerin type I domain-containing protein [Acidobacteriota bacterium]